MAAPSIPNLLTMRGSGHGRSRGGRGGRRGGAGGAGVSGDATIQGTDTDAAVSRLSAVDVGYLDDPYAKAFVTGPPTRRLPIINRGTYVRTRALDMLVADFLSESHAPQAAGPKQIISLGAGTDTRPFRLFASPRPGTLVYHEIDFEPTCRRKYQTVRSMPELAGSLQDVEVDEGGSWHARWRGGGGEYHCHATDLRDVDGFASAMSAAIHTGAPTLVLSECCLCYLSRDDTERLLHFFGSTIARLAVVIYEPMPLDDSFGQVMVSNLKARGVYMPSLESYKDHAGQEGRLRQAGFDAVGHVTVKDAWERWIDGREKERLDALEGLDEVEEWHLLAAHYVVAWGSKGINFGDSGARFMARGLGRGREHEQPDGV